MADHPNAERIRRALAAFAQGDMATMTELIARTLSGTSPAAGRCRVTTAVGTRSSNCLVGWCKDLRGPSPRSCMTRWGSDEHAVALAHASARRGSHTYDFNDAWVFHLQDGQITEAWWRPEDLYASDEFWT